MSFSFIESLQALGLANVPGINNGSLVGFAHGSVTTGSQAETRTSSEASFSQEALTNTTLQVYQHTLVRSADFSANKTTTGSKIMTGSFPLTGSILYVRNARREVILPAGAVSEAIVPIHHASTSAAYRTALRNIVRDGRLAMLVKKAS